MCLFFYTPHDVRGANAVMTIKMLQSTLQIRQVVKKACENGQLATGLASACLSHSKGSGPRLVPAEAYFPGLRSKVAVLLSGGDQSRAVLVQQVVSTESQLVSSMPPALINIWPE